VATRHQRAITLPVMPAPDYVEPLTDSALRRGALAVVPVRRARGGGLRRFARNRSRNCGNLCRTRDHVRPQVVMDIAAAASYSLAAVPGSSTQSWLAGSYLVLYLHRHNEAVKLSGLPGSLAEAG
jgi:hypothetical protein